MNTLGELRNEYQREGVGVLLAELLAKIVWSTARRYPPSEYSPYEAWDESACEDVMNDWITERLWGRGDLQAMLSSATTLPQFRAALTTSLRQFLTNKRRRSIASNLYKRVKAILNRDSRFSSVVPAGAGAEQRWFFIDHGPNASPLSLDDLVQVACELSNDDIEVVRYGPFSQKLSPILRDPELRRFLEHLLKRAEGSLTVSTIMDVMRSRFSLPIEENTKLDESIPSSRPGPADEATVTISARSVVSRLDLDESQVVAAYFTSHGSFSKAAESCGCASNRAREIVYRAFEMICECSESEDDARAIMQAVESLLLQPGD